MVKKHERFRRKTLGGLASLVTIGMTVAACVPMAQASTLNQKVTITYWAQGYYPSPATTPQSKQIITIMKGLVAQYEKLHPNVTIKLVTGPQAGSNEELWLQSGEMARDLPDIFWDNFDSTWQDYNKGWFYNETQLLKQKDPYAGGKDWRSTFDQKVLNSVTAPDGNIYDIPADGVGVAAYYNKTLFDKLGLKVPTTWAQFMHDQQVIKQKTKVIPFAFSTVNPNDSTLAWADILTYSQFLMNSVKSLDHDHDNYLNPKDVALDVKEGKMPNLNILKQQWTLIKNWSQYWPRGFSGPEDELQLFSTGKAAMMLNGCWDIGQLNSEKLPFKWGTFNFPVITKSSASLATGKAAKIYGAWGAAQWVIPAYEDKSKIPYIVDFLQFLSAKQNITTMTNANSAIPNIVRAKPQSSLKTFQANLPLIPTQHFESILDNTFATSFGKDAQSYLDGSLSLDSFLQDIKTLYQQGSQRLLQQN